MTDFIASVETLGGYCSPAKAVTILVLALPWLYVAPWVQRDARRVMVPPMLWGGCLLAAWALGMVLWLVLPIFGAGLAIYAVLTTGAGAAYVLHRNSKVDREYRILTPAHLKSLLSKGRAERTPVKTLLKVYDNDGRLVPEPTQDDMIEQREGYNRAQQLLYDLLFYRASEADLSPAKDEAKLRFIVDGVLEARPPLSLTESETAIQFLKKVAGVDVAERRRPQQGTISVDLAGQPIDLVLTTAGTTTGQRIQFRVVQEAIRTQIDELGISKEVLQWIRALNDQPRGVVLVAGRPKNGMTSTLYALLCCHDAFTKQLTTLEAKPDSHLENISQEAYKEPANQAKVLASVLRQEANVIMLDRCQSPETAKLATGSADGRLFLIGQQAPDTFTALAKWVKLCPDAATALKDLRGVLVQVLVRKLCSECREAYRPDPKLLTKANLADEKIEYFYRAPTGPRVDEKGKPLVDKDGQPIPCPTCRGTGYFGRTGVFELLEVNDEIRQLIVSGAPLQQIKAAGRKSGMLYLQEQALRKVVDGITSVQEVIRVTQPKK